MTTSFRRSVGMTLIELLVAGSLFGLFTSMVAAALVQAHWLQDQSVAKLDAVRHASLAQDIIARDIESARYASRVLMESTDSPPPASGVPPAPFGARPVFGDALVITRHRRDPDPSITFPQQYHVAYWFEPGATPAAPGRIRRATYFPAPPDTTGSIAPEAGSERVIAKEVLDFQVSTDTTSSAVSTVRVDIWAKTLPRPVTTFVATEPNPSPID